MGDNEIKKRRANNNKNKNKSKKKTKRNGYTFVPKAVLKKSKTKWLQVLSHQMWKVNFTNGFFYLPRRLFVCLFVRSVCCSAAFAITICLIKLNSPRERENLPFYPLSVSKVTREEYRTWCELCVILSAMHRESNVSTESFESFSVAADLYFVFLLLLALI